MIRTIRRPSVTFRLPMSPMERRIARERAEAVIFYAVSLAGLAVSSGFLCYLLMG